MKKLKMEYEYGDLTQCYSDQVKKTTSEKTLSESTLIVNIFGKASPKPSEKPG